MVSRDTYGDGLSILRTMEISQTRFIVQHTMKFIVFYWVRCSDLNEISCSDGIIYINC